MDERSQKPRLKPTLQFFPAAEGIFHVYDPTSSRHFKMGEVEVEWIKLVDGTRSRADFDKIIPEQHCEAFFSNLDSMGLIDGAISRRKLNPFKLQLNFSNPAQILARMESISILYRNALNAFSPILLCANAGFLIMQWKSMVHSAMTIHPALGLPVVAYLIAILLVSFVHESSHALTARSFGVNVTAVGLMLYFLNPMFYVDVSGIGVLKKKSQRINVMLAGVMSNNLLVTLALVAYLVCRQFAFAPYLVYFILLNAGLIISNLIPFLEFDGYYVFREMLGESDFADNARSSLRKGTVKSFEYWGYTAASHLLSTAMVFSVILALRGYALGFANDNLVDRIAIISMGAFYMMQLKDLLMRVQYPQEDPHITGVSKSSIWAYRGLVLLMAFASTVVRDVYHMQFASLFGIIAVLAMIPWLVRICLYNGATVCRQMFNSASIYAAAKLLLFWISRHHEIEVLRPSLGDRAFFGVVQEICFLILISALMITILFYVMSIAAYAALHAMRKNQASS